MQNVAWQLLAEALIKFFFLCLHEQHMLLQNVYAPFSIYISFTFSHAIDT